MRNKKNKLTPEQIKQIYENCRFHSARVRAWLRGEDVDEDEALKSLSWISKFCLWSINR